MGICAPQALLRGSPSTRGFRGRLQESLHWLEDRSPGAKARFFGDRLKGWPRNVGPAHEAVLVRHYKSSTCHGWVSACLAKISTVSGLYRAGRPTSDPCALPQRRFP
jgi:hypothetical protein